MFAQRGQDLLRHVLLEHLRDRDEVRRPEVFPAPLRRGGIRRPVGTDMQPEIQAREVPGQGTSRPRERLRQMGVEGHDDEPDRRAGLSGHSAPSPRTASSG